MSCAYPVSGAAASRPKFLGWLADAERLDVAVYWAIARTPTPTLDRLLSRLTRAADHSKLSLAGAGMLALGGGPTGRRAAGRALAVLVAYSRVHTGAHYPGDVIAGALTGATLAGFTSRAVLRRGR